MLRFTVCESTLVAERQSQSANIGQSYFHKENQCMMGTDPDLQTIFHIYALMSLCFAHIRLYFEINRHTADYRLLTVCCEVLFMTNYVKRMMPHCFWALQTTSLWVQGNRILRKELNIAQQQKKQIVKGK